MLRSSRTMFSTKSSVSLRKAWRRLSSKPAKMRMSGVDGTQVSQVEPLLGEVGDEDVGARIGQHAADLAFEDGGLFEFALGGGVEEFVVGDAAPEEEARAARRVRESLSR